MDDIFDIKELTKFEQDLVKLANDTMPKESKVFIKKEAGKLTTKNKAVFKDKGINDELGDIQKGFKAGKAYKFDGSWSARAYNNAPHAHLLDKGHLMVGHKPDKKSLTLKYGGTFVPGFHFMDDAAAAFEGTYNEDVDKFIDQVLAKGLGM
jgi:hypothetical protein